MNYDETIVNKVSETLVRAGSVFLPDKRKPNERAISSRKE